LAKRLRIFAGPNGSGKSTIEAEVSSKYNIGHLINADNIESVLRNGHAIHFNSYGIKVTPGELRNHFMHTGFADKIDIRRLSGTLNVKNNILRLNSTDAPYSYVGAILTELIRNKSLGGNRTFSFETVMSHASKLDYINIAREKGFKTKYLVKKLS
jgi:predicted ABC-type ATPase